MNPFWDWLGRPPRVPKNARAKVQSLHHCFDLHISSTDTNISRKIFAEKIWEPHITKIFESIIQPGDTVIDIGAHIGYFSILAGLCLKKQGHVFAFEPNNENFEILLKNIDLNQMQNVVIPINKAAGSEKAAKELYGTDKLDPSDRFLYKTKKSIFFQKIECVRVEDYLKENFPDALGKLHVVKMDIEGFEAEAVKGLGSLLDHPGIILVTELNRGRLEGAGTSPEEYVQMLKKRGFKISIIKPFNSPGNGMRPLCDDDLTSLSMNEHEDLYCVK